MLIVDFIRILNYWVVEGIFVELIKWKKYVIRKKYM